jgi:hypothetical protein
MGGYSPCVTRGGYLGLFVARRPLHDADVWKNVAPTRPKFFLGMEKETGYRYANGTYRLALKDATKKFAMFADVARHLVTLVYAIRLRGPLIFDRFISKAAP